MEWLQNNSWLLIIITLVFVIVLLGVTIFLLSKVRVIARNTIDSSLKMTATLMFESDHGAEFMDITIYNTNFRDVIVRDFGIIYLNQHLNFVSEYVEAKQLGSLPIVHARSSISFRIDPQRVEKFILGHNYKSRKISKIFNVVVDSVGNQFCLRNKGLTHILKTRQKERIKAAKIIIHDTKIEDYKKNHDDREPVSNYFYKLFHRSGSKNPKIITLANSLNDNHSTKKEKTSEAVFDKPNLEVNDSVEMKRESTLTPSVSGEVKVTFLEREKAPRKKKTAPPVSEDSTENTDSLQADTDSDIK